jgi:hypothetical protein
MQPFCSKDAECGRGVCSEDGACVCFANYVGDRCEVSILGMRLCMRLLLLLLPADSRAGNLSYLPPVHPKHSPQRCFKSRAFEQGSAELLQRLAAAHEMPKCWERDSVRVFLVPHHGLGGNVHLMQQCITRALYEGKGAVFRWRAPPKAPCACHLFFTICNLAARQPLPCM